MFGLAQWAWARDSILIGWWLASYTSRADGLSHRRRILRRYLGVSARDFNRWQAETR